MSNTPRARSLARLLRAAQESSGLSVRTVAERLNWSKSRVSRIENIQQDVTEADVAALLAILGVTGSDRDQLLRMVRELDEPVWWELHKDLPDQLSMLIDAERRAAQMTCVSPTLIPGLLQTRGYSRAVFEASEKTTSEIEQAIALRQTRQGVIETRDAVDLVAYIDEPVLWRPVRQDIVRRDQLEHLLKVSTRPNITVRIVPLDADLHFGLNGTFTILEFDADEPHVFAEAPNAGSMITGSDDVAGFYRAVERVSEVALDPAASARLIEQHLHDQGSTDKT